MPRSRGFTLLELIVTIAVIGILSAVGIPAFNDMVRSNRATSEANALLAALTQARGEAIKRNGMAVVCKTANGTSCATTASDAWNVPSSNASGCQPCGYVVFVDAAYSGTVDERGTCNKHVVDGTDPVVRTEYPLYKGSAIKADSVDVSSGAINARTDCVIYGSNGRVLNDDFDSYNVQFSIVPPGSDKPSRKVEINANGRPRILVCKKDGTCT